MRHALAIFLLLGPLAGGALAQATPRSVGDCERIRGDLAYNQCLALFGPAARVKGATAYVAPDTALRLPEMPASAEPAAEPAPAAARGRGRHGRRAYRGRQRASFSIMAGGEGRSYRRRR
ncbi:hypothetical protein [Methylobacterium isbiliense]|jgi:hypothetical protein|uniref:Uncharacterized protein n=1 Tax=Methylobacterium isbiliense TaxID=315478 RepID=A0ABQ4SGY5_9HYPH|nr:hypothetical protein [Methylobacterium isbiliense]MDN3624261.1 hypothetical protein [Methylobacterium isbiliense]GJE01023.1 hypothetical protein GMJLKIPL_2952 [Methylobacterium isbiliense]